MLLVHRVMRMHNQVVGTKSSRTRSPGPRIRNMGNGICPYAGQKAMHCSRIVGQATIDCTRRLEGNAFPDTEHMDAAG